MLSLDNESWISPASLLKIRDLKLALQVSYFSKVLPLTFALLLVNRGQLLGQVGLLELDLGHQFHGVDLPLWIREMFSGVKPSVSMISKVVDSLWYLYIFPRKASCRVPSSIRLSKSRSSSSCSSVTVKPIRRRDRGTALMVSSTVLP